MVAAQDAIAARVGRDILAKGGNAVDAAVATGFALAVIHHQWLPDVIITEPGISADTVKMLEQRGFIFQRGSTGKYKRSTLGRANAVMYKDGYFYGAADLRSPTSGASAVE